MGTIRETTKSLVADARLTAADATKLVETAKAGGVAPDEKADLQNTVTRYRDAFDAGGWKVMKDNAATLGIKVEGSNHPGELSGRPELAELSAGKKAISTTKNRNDPAVVTLQRGLMELAKREKNPALGLRTGGADGDYGNETAGAVKAFQSSRGLKADGVFGKQTLAALTEALAKKPGVPESGPVEAPAVELKNGRFASDAQLKEVAAGAQTIGRGSKGTGVTAVQQALVDLGYPLMDSKVDGAFGKLSAQALSAFQKDQGLPPNGKLDAATLAKLDKVAPAPGAVATLSPEYGKMYADGVLDVTLGIGFDEDGSDLYERKKVLDGLSQRGFKKLDVTVTDATLVKKGLDPAKIDRKGTYYVKSMQVDGKDVQVLVKYVDRYTTGHKERFVAGMQQSELLLYAGHARYGSGPDFDTKESVAGNVILGANAKGHADGTLTESYDPHMREILKGAGNDLEKMSLTNDYQMMFFSGCSTKNYLDELRGIPGNKSAANLDFIGSNEALYWNNVGDNVLGVLDGVMSRKTLNEMDGELVARNDGLTFVKDGFAGNPA